MIWWRRWTYCWRCGHSPTHLLTHSLTHSLTYSHTYSLTQSLTHLVTHSLTYSILQEKDTEIKQLNTEKSSINENLRSLKEDHDRIASQLMTIKGYSLTHLLTHSLTYSLTHLLTHLLTYLLTHSLTHLLTYSLTHSLTYLLTYSLTHAITMTRSSKIRPRSVRKSTES